MLPAELLHVDYASPIREFLLRRFASVTVVTFDEAVFPGATIDTVLLLAEDGPAALGLRVVALPDASRLAESFDGRFSPGPEQRWSSLRAPGRGVQALERLRNQGKLARLSSIASVDIGCVTGANDFFVLTRDQADALNLSRDLLQPIVVRPAHLPGVILTAEDVRSLAMKERCLLLKLSEPGLESESTMLGRYLRQGLKLGIHMRYKCRARDPWYSVPSVRVPDAFLSYMSHHAPRVTLNQAGFSSTNLVHQIKFTSVSRPWAAAYIAALHSSIALLSFELEGRSYGGGVFKLETREAERVEMPFLDVDLARVLAELLVDVDRAVREGDHSRAAAVVDDALLRCGVLDKPSLAEIRLTWARLRERRADCGRAAS